MASARTPGPHLSALPVSILAMTRMYFVAGHERVPTIWDHRYCTDAAPTISTTKQAEVVRRAAESNLLDLRPWPFSGSLAWAGIEAVHDADYVRAVRTGRPLAAAESQGFTWSPAFADAVVRTWAGHLAACRLARETGLVLHPVSGAHHARRGRGAGFCTFNFLVGAGRAALDAGHAARVAIVDLDAHQGDGTWALAADDPRFAVFDLAGEDWIGERHTDRVTMAVVHSAAAYADCLAELPRFLDRVAPDLVQYQAGMDCHQDDPIGAIPGVDAEFLAWRDRFVMGEVTRRGIPLVVNLAGGYQDAGRTVALHVETVRVAAELLHAATGRRQRSA